MVTGGEKWECQKGQTLVRRGRWEHSYIHDSFELTTVSGSKICRTKSEFEADNIKARKKFWEKRLHLVDCRRLPPRGGCGHTENVPIVLPDEEGSYQGYQKNTGSSMETPSAYHLHQKKRKKNKLFSFLSSNTKYVPISHSNIHLTLLFRSRWHTHRPSQWGPPGFLRMRPSGADSNPSLEMWNLSQTFNPFKEKSCRRDR